MSTKEHILKAAENLFCKKGYHTTTIRDIAVEASANSAMVSYYFRSKENLYLEILESIQSDFNIDAILEELPQLDKRIDAFIDYMIEVFNRHPKAVYLAMVEQLQSATEQTKQFINRMEQKHFQRFCSIINTEKNISNEQIKNTYHAILGVMKEWLRIQNKNNKEIEKLTSQIEELNQTIKKIILVNGLWM